MPHIIIEHSADFKKDSIQKLGKDIQETMSSLEGNFDADQCKVRRFSFDEYMVGKLDQSSASFIHISLKILSGRTLEVRQDLSAAIAKLSEQFILDSNLENQRCDLSVDVIEMPADTYQKIRAGI